MGNEWIEGDVIIFCLIVVNNLTMWFIILYSFYETNYIFGLLSYAAYVYVYQYHSPLDNEVP